MLRSILIVSKTLLKGNLNKLNETLKVFGSLVEDVVKKF